MNAKIVLLSCDAASEANTACAERLLGEIALAFDHGLSLVRCRSGLLPDGALPEDTVKKCMDARAVFCGKANDALLNSLYDALGSSCAFRSFSLPHAVTGTEELRFYIAQVLSLDVDTLPPAVEEAFRFAQGNDLSLSIVPPNGHTRKLWDNCVNFRIERSRVVTRDLSAPDAARMILRSPQSLGILLVPAYAGGILAAEAETVSPCADFLFDFAPGKHAVYAPFSAAAVPNVPGCVGAVSALLRESLDLAGEAACLDAAFESVLAQGKAQSPQSMLDLICEQMAVAGDLTGLKFHS